MEASPVSQTGFWKMARMVALCVGSRRRGGMEAAGPGGVRQISDTGRGCRTKFYLSMFQVWRLRPQISPRAMSVGGCGPRMFEIGTSVEHLGPASEICRTPQGRRLSLHCVGGHPSAARPVKPISEIRSKIQDRLPSRADAGQACRTKVGLTLTPVTDSGPRFRC